MKIVIISDTHGAHADLKVPDGDILLHSGDICMSAYVKTSRILESNESDLRSFNSWIGKLPHKHKIVIAGNHDFFCEEFPVKTKKILSNCHYLNDSGVEIEGLKVWGSPWQPEFGGWAFNEKRGDPIASKWEKIPSDTQILLTHGPPYGILDRVHGNPVGCEELRKRVDSLDSLLLHSFGHIHCARGYLEKDSKSYFNAALVNQSYKIVHEPFIFNLP